MAFTFNYVKQYANSKTDDINLGGLNITSVSTSGNTVTVNFPSPQYMNLEHIAGQAILPKHIWSTVTNPATSPTPSRSAPARTRWAASPPRATRWWRTRATGSPVPVKKVYFPVYTTNNAAQTALFSREDRLDG